MSEEDFGPICELSTFKCSECYVYKVPPARTSAGHRAQDWNVDKWLQKVQLRIAEQGDTCTVRLLEEESGELFAACPVPTDMPLFTAVEPVVDSSRYFCLQVVDTTGAASGPSGGAPRHAFVGLGFQDREQAYDFMSTLQDFVRRMDRQKQAERLHEASVQDEHSASDGFLTKRDYSLKEGESIHMNLKLGGSHKSPYRKVTPTTANMTTVTLLPPPFLVASSNKSTGVSHLNAPPLSPHSTKIAELSPPSEVAIMTQLSTEPNVSPTPDARAVLSQISTSSSYFEISRALSVSNANSNNNLVLDSDDFGEFVS
mmetsp:Transcript_4775/g.6433  ORF Transcript_4775/g.6433 Transcript_4775/m.6433 type:complete len:314 (-) Transcript_4775:37-978(-)